MKKIIALSLILLSCKSAPKGTSDDIEASRYATFEGCEFALLTTPGTSYSDTWVHRPSCTNPIHKKD